MRSSRLMLSLVGVVVALHLSGCQRSATTGLEKAKARIAKDDDAGAEIDLKNFLQRNPDSAEARYLLGVQAQKRGDPAAAQIELQRALDLKHTPSLVVPAIALNLLSQGKFKQLIDEFGSTELPDTTATAELQGLVAQAKYFEGDIAGANELIDKAAAAAPASERVQLIKAGFAAQAGKSDQALAVLDALIAKKADSHQAWTMKGNVLGVMPSKRNDAMDAFRKSLAIKPTEIAPRTGLIALSLQAGDIDKASAELALLQKQASKSPNTVFYEANLAFAKGKYTEAQSLYQAVLKAMPLHPAVLIGAAENELKLNATAQAESLALKALGQSPDNPRARQLLAQIYLRMGQPAKAIANLAGLVDNPRAPADILALAAQAQLMSGNVSAADQLYVRMAKANPSDPVIQTILATSNLGKASNQQVYDTLQGISADDKGTSADLALISALLRARQFDAAVKAADTLIKKQPEQAISYQTKAQVLARNNDMAGAEKALKQALGKDATYLPAVLGLATIDMRNRKPEQAKQRIEELIKKQPGNAHAMVALAELSAAAGMPATVVLGYLERAAKINPSDTSIWAALIDQQLHYGNLRATLASAQAAVAVNPKSVELLDRLARAQVRNGQADQALSTFGNITSLHPGSLAGLLGQAEVQIVSGNLADAGRNISKVLERDPQNPLAQNLAFGIALQQKQFKAAAEVARVVQKQRPAAATATLMEAEIEAQQGHRDAAMALWRKALTLNNPGQAALKLHSALVQAGKAADADAMATAWLKDHPNDLDFLLQLATQARQQGRTDLAEQRYRQVIAMQPTHVLALNHLARMLAQQGKADAVALAEQALKYAPESPAVLDTLARAFDANKQLSKAVDAQKRAVLLAPNEPSLRLALAQLEFKSGDKASAKRNLDGVVGQAAKLDAEERATMTTLVKALTRG